MERDKVLSASLKNYYKNCKHIKFHFFGQTSYAEPELLAIFIIKNITFKSYYNLPHHYNPKSINDIDHLWADLHSKIIDEIEVLEKMFKI